MNLKLPESLISVFASLCNASMPIQTAEQDAMETLWGSSIVIVPPMGCVGLAQTLEKQNLETLDLLFTS
jgi:hypothetical protein